VVTSPLAAQSSGFAQHDLSNSCK